MNPTVQLTLALHLSWSRFSAIFTESVESVQFKTRLVKERLNQGYLVGAGTLTPVGPNTYISRSIS